MKHPHYDLIVQWAENPGAYRVEFYDVRGEWESVDSWPIWDSGTNYRLIPLKKYRVALFVSGAHAGSISCTETADNEDTARRFESDSDFVRWLTDWVTYE